MFNPIYIYIFIFFQPEKFDWFLTTEIGLPGPDVLFFLNIEPKLAATRSNFGEGVNETVELQTKVAKQYQKLVSLANGKQCHVIFV